MTALSVCFLSMGKTSDELMMRFTGNWDKWAVCSSVELFVVVCLFVFCLF